MEAPLTGLGSSQVHVTVLISAIGSSFGVFVAQTERRA